MYIAALVIGIIGFLVGLIPFIGWLVVPLNLIAVGIGLYGVFKRNQLHSQDYNLALASLILGGIPLILKYIIWH